MSRTSQIDELQYQCCFCGLVILPTAPDVGLLDYSSEFQNAPKDRKTQSFFCHTNCFVEQLQAPAALYVLET
jgi:hypothetical protein